MSKEIEKVNKESKNIADENLQKLGKVFPNFVKDGEVDFEALRRFFATEGLLADEKEKYGLSWAGKTRAFELIRERAGGTLEFDRGESLDPEDSENLFIEGDNLEVLKLLQKRYREQIKMIYIDPPYNTGKDFIYKDNFKENLSDYYERTGQSKDGIKLTSNPESAGRYHSDWLTMMYPRLFLARNLLREDGVIFISIDDHEVANLRLIMDEIFGEENFVATFTWKRKKEVANDSRNVAVQGEYILCYSKTESTELNSESLSEAYLKKSYNKPTNYFPDGKWRPVPITVSKGLSGGGYKYKIQTPAGKIHERLWAYPEKSFKKLLTEKKIYFGKEGDSIPQRVIYEFESEGKPVGNFWEDVSTNKEGKKEIIKFFDDNYFDTPKPPKLIRKLLQISTDNEHKDICLDFFAGSGTLAQAVMEQNSEDEGNRKWICVQIPEETDEKSEARKAGYSNIAQIARERIRRASKKIQEENKKDLEKLDLGFKAFALKSSNYRPWKNLDENSNREELLKQSKLIMEKPLVNNYQEEAVVYEILLKEGFDLASEVKKEKTGDLEIWKVESQSAESGEGNKKMLVSFASKISKEQAESLELDKEDIFVCLDSALDDNTKINLSRNLTLKVI